MRCRVPRVDRLNPAFNPGKYPVAISLNGMQYSEAAAGTRQFFFYNRPHVSSLQPQFGAYTGGTKVSLSSLAGAPFVDPSEGVAALNQIACMYRSGKTKLRVPANFDALSGDVQCTSPPTDRALTVRVEVALNGQQFTKDYVNFCYTPLLSAMDIDLGPISGGTRILVEGTGFFNNRAEGSMSCRFRDRSGAVVDQFNAVREFIDSEHIVCASPEYDALNPYPNMYPVSLEVSMNACEACRFGNHYSQTSKGNIFRLYADPIVEFLGLEPLNSGLMDGGQELTISGQRMVTVADPMPSMYCAFLGDQIHTTTLVIVPALVDVANEAVKCSVPSVTEPQDVYVELSLNSQQYTSAKKTFNFYDPIKPPGIENMRPKSGPKEGGTLITFYGTNVARSTGMACLINNVTGGQLHPVVTNYFVNYEPKFVSSWSMTCRTSKNYHLDPALPGYGDLREDAGKASVSVTNGDLGDGAVLWSNVLSYEFTETFAPRCSAYQPTVNPRRPDYWARSPAEMAENYVLQTVAGDKVDFRIVARDKYGDARPFGADFFYVDMTQDCASIKPGPSGHRPFCVLLCAAPLLTLQANPGSLYRCGKSS